MYLQERGCLFKHTWLRVILDEGHHIRNPNTGRSKAMEALKCERKWVLTGKVEFFYLKYVSNIMGFNRKNDQNKKIEC